ncbi:MAG TPA: peptidoglycan-binding protein [Candidatus Paceibacterota bacterium]
MNSKKLVSAALTATTVLWMVGAAALVPVASAQTTSSLQAQIAALLAQIQTLQTQLNASGGSTSMTYDFSSDLTVGSTGAQVTALQQFLINKGYLTAVSAPTGYFGPLTASALAKFQAANGITPSVGYFGPKTRAFVNSMSSTGTTTGTLPAGCTTSSGFSPTTGASCSTGVTVSTGAPMSVALDAQTPRSTNVAGGAVNTPVLKLDFTAGATPVTVTNLVLTRTGLSQDQDLNNVYIYSGATKLASNLGFNNGAITFSNGAGLFTVPANSTLVLSVNADVASSSNSGHIFQIGLTSAANVTGGTFSGNFPLESGNFTIANVTGLATLTITSATSTASTTVNSGQLDDLVGQMTVLAGNNPVKVNAVTFTNIGSVTPSYLQNVKLMDGSTQLGATLSSLGSNNIATFDLSGAPLMLTSGQSAVLSLYADVTGGVGRTFQFSIQQSSDIQAEDTTYGVGIGASIQGLANNSGFPVTFSNVQINQGGVVASRDAASPTTNVVAGNTNQALAKFDVLASGDSIKFNEMDFKIAGNSGVQINNFRVVDDQGAQIGTTVSPTLATGSSTVAEGSGSLNYIIPANTTRVLTVYGDIPSSATGTIAVTFGTGNTTAQSYTTYYGTTVSPVPGNTLNILSGNSNLSVSENYGLGTPVSASAGAQQVKIGSYTLTAGQVNSINLTGITLQVTSTVLSAHPTWLTNLEVMDGSTQLGQTYATVAYGNTYSFNGNSSIAIPANGSVTLDVYANVSANATASTTAGGVTALYSVNANTVSGNAITVSSTPGQDVAFNTGGTLTGTISAGTSQASYLGMNVPGVNVAQYQFAADNHGNETLTQVVIQDSNTTANTSTIGAGPSDLINYRLTDTSGNSLGTANEQAGVLTFNISEPVTVNGTVYVNLVADTNAYPYATSSDAHAYNLQSFQYTNATQSQTTQVAIGSGMGNLFTVYQASLGISAGSFSNPTSISGVGNTVGAFNFTVGANAVKSIQIKSITIAANGSLIGATTTETLGVYDGTTLLGSATVTSTASTTISLNGINTLAEAIAPNSTKTLLIEPTASPTGLNTVTSGGGNYQIILKNITWSDGVTTTITGFSPSLGTQVAGQSISGLSN